MAIHTTVLGGPGRDNAVHAIVDSGQRRVPLLFDCGEGCVSELTKSETHEIEHVFFSHFHMDHIAGFDGFFRANYDRADRPVHVWGPPGTIEVMHHRFRGFLWNLHEGRPGTWIVHDIHPDHVANATFRLSDAFTQRYHESRWETDDGLIIDDPDFQIRARALEHHGPSMAYRIDETEQRNIDPAKLAALDLRPGPWLEAVKSGDASEIDIHGTNHNLSALREELLVRSQGDSFAYLTDFHSVHPSLADWLRGCRHVVCEAQYLHRDLDLARKNAHMTAQMVGQLSAAAELGKVTLFHLSERYSPEEWEEMLGEVRSLFPEANFPAEWPLK